MSGLTIKLISLNPAFVKAGEGLTLPPGVCPPECVNIFDIPADGTVFVSPANSLGFMDGGIDDCYRKMFPGCEHSVKQMIRELNYTTQLGRPYLRVGSACWQLVHSNNAALITAPTMFLPHDVSRTQNAYWATIAALRAVDKIRTRHGFHTLVIPSLCCGYGRMSEVDSLHQILRGITDWQAGRVPAEIEDRGERYVLLPSRDSEQPSNFDNREIGIPWPVRTT